MLFRWRNCLVWAAIALLFVSLAAAAEEEYDEEESATIPYVYENGVLTVPEGVEYLGYFDAGPKNVCDLSTFRLFGITRLSLPSTLKVIGSDGLYGLAAEELTIPEGVVQIDAYALQYSDVRRISLPSTLKTVDGSTFADCDALETVVLAPDNPWFTLVDGVLFSKDGKTLVYYPAGRRDASYQAPAGTEAIGTQAFCGNDWLETLSLPFGVKTIANSGIRDMGNLRAVALPLTLQTVGDYAFANDVNLEQMALSPRVTVGEGALSNCPKLTGIEEQADFDLSDVKAPDVRAVVNTDSADGMASLYQRPTSAAPVTARLGRGSTVLLLGQTNGFYQVRLSMEGSEAAVEGYLAKEDATLAAPAQSLFTLKGVAPKNASSRFFYNDYVFPFRDPGRPFPASILLRSPTHWGTYILFETYPLAETDEDGLDVSYWNYAFPGDLLLTREKTGDGLTYGMVISPKPGNRLNVRAQPQKDGQALDKLFSGTQVKVEEEAGDWYRISYRAYDLSGWKSGYAMKEYIQIVPEE